MSRRLRASEERADRPGARSSQAFGYLSLFTSFGTLICCALPSLLVLAGLGATVASFLSAAPWLVTLSRHKDWVFAGSGALMASTFAYVYAVAPKLRGRAGACATEDTAACGAADRVSRVVLWMSLALYSIGFFAAYALGPILVWSESALPGR